MRAVILAGGKGTRLKPYTITLPKPLVPVADEPILEIIIRNLRKQGIDELDICVNHMGHLIESYFGNGEEYGVKIKYSYERKALGTVAPIKLIKDLPDNFIVMNGDVLTDLSYEDLFSEHKNSNAILTIATFQREENIDYGVIRIDDDGTIYDFGEKPKITLDVSMGVYAFNKRVFDYVPDDAPFGLDDLMQVLLKNKELVKAHQHSGYWMDIGRPSDYEQANEDYKYFLEKTIVYQRKKKEGVVK